MMDAVEARPWIATAIVVGSAVVGYLVLTRLGQRFVNRIGSRGAQAASRANTLWRMIRRVAQVTVIVLTILLVFSIWEISLAPFIAVGTVLAAALGFGAQNVVRDVLAGFFILAEDQYQIGDTVLIAGARGTVEDIQFRVTVLRDGEGNVHFVPNGQITVTSNYTRVFARPVIDIKIPYGQDIDQAMALMEEEMAALAADPDYAAVFRTPPEMLGVESLTDAGPVLRVRLTTDAADRWKVRREALRRITERFNAEGVDLTVK